MRLLAWLVLCACAVAAATQSHNVTRRESGSGPQKRVVCYYTNWSVYRPGTAKFSPQNINPYLCTHLIYAFGGLTRENSLRPYDKYQDIEQGGYAKFTGLKTYNKQLKTMLAIGGWNEGSTRFSPLVADEERRSELVHNVVRFLRQNHFDGLDLDWEYPAFRDGGKPRDRENYALLVQELRAEFDRESAKTGRPRLLLTMAVPAGIEYIDKGYDIPKLNRYLDFMNILSYDYHSAFEPAVNHHSPLYPLEEDSEYNFDAQLSIDYTINHYVKLGADRDKLVLGIPTYGRSYTLYNPLATEIGSPADGPGEQGDATREKGYLAYYEICENLQSDGWKVEHPNRNAMGPYAYKGNQWVGYDDIDIVKLKSQYVSENGLGGIMFWSIDNDDFRGKCHGRPYPLIEAGKDALLASSGTSNDVVSVAPTRGHSKTRPKHPSSNSSSSGNSSGRQGPQGGPHTHKKRPSSRRQHDKPTRSTTSRASTTTTTPAYSYPQTTPEPPTTPDPGSDFKCKDEGFFPHPRDCKKYFWCLDSGPSNLGIVAHQFTCPSGLFFNKAADSCDYARNVVCKKKSGETGSSTTKAPPITAATSRTTRIGSSTATTTTSTTTAAPQPAAEQEEYEDEYDEEGEEEVDAEEDPQAIKELINLIKKLGGVEQLEKQLHLQDSDQDKSGQVTSGFSRSLYDRVLSRSNARGNSAFSGGSSTTPRYTSLYRNRPVKPQNEGLEGLEEVKAVRREKPQYVTIKRDRPATPEPEDLEDEEEEDEEEDVLLPEDEREGREDAKSQSNPVEYVTIRRARPLSSAAADITTPRYITIQRSRKPVSEPEVDDTARDADVQDITTEIRPVYTTTTEREPETRVQIVTPVKTLATEKPTGYRKVSRNGGHETTTAEPDQKVVTTTARNFRRPTGALYNPNRVRLRSTTSTTTTTTETPASSTGPEQERRKPGARLVRRRKYGPSANRTADSDATASEVKSSDASNNAPTDKDGSGGRVRKFSFPRRRTTTTAPPVTTRPVAVTTLPTSGAPEETQSDIELMESKEHKFTEAEAEAELTTTKLPDLANSAVVAIHNLATVPPTTQPTPEVVKSTRTSLTTARSSSTTSSTPAASRLFPRRGSAVFASEEPPPSPSPSPRSLPGSVSLKPRPFSKTTAAPVFETDTHARTPKPRPLPVIDYEYYDDEEGILDVAPISGKVKIHSDGYIECLDRGNFPHPFSCKKFISCAKMENGELLGWEYTCPRQLSFDPIGGICNWSAGLGCKE
ncbi:hypothetical protein B7P43_G09842 [Cryptotermes secundus]|uniref:Mucin-5AC n=2 Tax=Cryptotermes secundus TaxID=105785 RepID=A0A2J7Q380_9NEOP|nr:hypothetical protein B7P43_G09842 [Cryptotermes secundus]